MSITWSEDQETIFNWFADGDGNLVVRARAGTGKTTTIIHAVSLAPEPEVLLAAFNKKIATELDERLTRAGAEARTLHSIGFGFIRRNWVVNDIDNKSVRAWTIGEMACGENVPVDVRKEVVKLSTKLKAVAPMITFNVGGSITDIVDKAVAIADRFGITVDEDFEEFGYDMDFLASAAIKMLDIGATHKDGTIDFDDMIWLPVRHNWARPKYDLVVIDEAQDMNRTQVMLAQAVCRKSGRIAVVGDDRQAIYGFRGADAKSIDRLSESLNAKELGLRTTYRCGKNIVNLAQRLVPDFEAHEGNEDGVVTTCFIEQCVEAAQPGDFILSRTNAPLVATCLALLRNGTRANIEGRDVGAGLSAIVRKLSRGRASEDVGQFIDKLDKWAETELAKAKKRGDKGLHIMASIRDKHRTLHALLDGLTSANELLSRISKLFADTKGKGARVVLSSVHKSKGLEADNVWLLRDTFFSLKSDPPKWAMGIEEKNLEYVAITRAKMQLIWVDGLL